MTRISKCAAQASFLRDCIVGIGLSMGLALPTASIAMPQDSTVYYRFKGQISSDITRSLPGMGPTSPSSIYEFNTLVYSNGPTINADPLIRPAGGWTSFYRDRGGAEWIRSNMSIFMTAHFMHGFGGGHKPPVADPGAGLFRKTEYSGTSADRGWTRIRFNPGTTKSSLSQPFAVRRSVIPIGSYPESHIRNRTDRWATTIPLAEMGIAANRLLFVQALHIGDPEFGSSKTPYNQAVNNGINLGSAFSVRGQNGGQFTFDLSQAPNAKGTAYDFNRGWITAEYRAADCADGFGTVLTSSTNVGSRTVSAITWNGSAYASNASYAGCNGHNNGTYVFESTGDNIYNTSDTFRFGHRSESGNREIRVRIDQLENTNEWARGGIMIRQGTAANARNVAVFLTPGNGIIFQARHSNTSTQTLGTASNTITKAPVWLRLRYDDVNDVTRAYYSNNGTTWVQVSSNFLIADFSNYQMGLATASRSSFPHSTVFSNLTHTSTLSPP